MIRFYDENQIRMYLSTLFKHTDEGYLELRPINDNTSSHLQEFYPISEGVQPVIDKVRDIVGEYNIFIGINPRGHKAGSDADISELICFWADIDAKDFDGDKSKAKESISKFALEPTIIVDSGNGYHCYWMLSEPWNLKSENDRLEAKKISQAIHTLINADSTFNLSRILRVPGTPNIKEPNDWKPCTLKTLNMGMEYSISDFYENIPADALEQQSQNYTVDLSMNSRVKDLDTLKRFVDDNIIHRAKSIPARFEGDRSANDFWIATKLYESGLNDAEVYQAFTIFKDLEWDAGYKFSQRGDEYLLEYTLPTAKNKTNKFQDILDKIKQADDKERASCGVFKILSQMGSIEYDQSIRQLQEAWGGRSAISLRAIRQRVQKERRKLNTGGGNQFFEYAENGSKNFIPPFLASNIEQEEDFMFTADTLYYYSGGVYKPKGDSYLRKGIQDKLGKDWKKSFSEEVVTFLKERNYTNPLDRSKYPGLINVKNGMVDIKTGQLKEHSPSYESTIQFPVDYDPNATCDRLEQFMAEVFPADTIDLMWEHAGYILLSGLELKRFLILVGRRNAGKSIFLNVLSDVIGVDNIAGESLQNLANHKYSTAQLFGRVANIYADLDNDAVEQTGVIKMLTGGDRIRGEVKYGQTFYFYNTAKLLFSCNQLPPVFDYNEAFFKRLHIVRCPNQFLGDKANNNIMTDLTNTQAKSTFLNKAIEGAKRLLKQGDFTQSESVNNELTGYRLSSDSVSEFIHLQTTPDTGSWEGKDTIYIAYKSWCKENSRKPVGKSKFTRRAKSAPNNWTDFNPSNRAGQQVSAWKNIRMTDMASRGLRGVTIENDY